MHDQLIGWDEEVPFQGGKVIRDSATGPYSRLRGWSDFDIRCVGAGLIRVRLLPEKITVVLELVL